MADNLAARVDASLTFADYEICDLGPNRLAGFERQEPRLERHILRLHKILTDCTHLPPKGGAEVLTDAQRWPLVASDAVNTLYETRAVWPTLMISSRATAVTPEAFDGLRREHDTIRRRAANAVFFKRLKDLEPFFGMMLVDRVKADLTLARAQRFHDGMDALLFSEGMPADAVSQMIAVAHSRASLLRRYISLRAKALDVSESYADSFVSPPLISTSFSVARTKAITLAIGSEFGATFEQKLASELATPWIHLPPWPQKRAGYGYWGNNIGGKPGFGFMKYDGSYRSSRNYTGLAISAMAFWTMPKDRPTDTRVDPGVYGNALLFAANVLHNDYLRKHAANRSERIAYLIAGLDRFRQIMFDEPIIVEHLRDVQAIIARGEVPTGHQIARSYLTILRNFYQDAMSRVDPMFADDWMTNGLEFYSFEDQNFPLAMAAGCALVQGVHAHDRRTIDGFTNVRGRIGSDFSYDLLKAAGVDLATASPYQAAMQQMTAMVNELDHALQHP